MGKRRRANFMVLSIFLLATAGCAGVSAKGTFRDPNMDFGLIQTVAVMPFANLTREQYAGDRARDAFMNALQATGAMYVVPPGEVMRGILRASIQIQATPSTEEIVKFAGIVKADTVITGVVREYGDVRSGATAATVISLSLQMMETQTGKVIWSATSTKGGVTTMDRLFGGGGEPMDVVTGKAMDDLLDQLFGK